MIRTPAKSLILFPLLVSSLASAQVSEKERLSGFAEHQKNQIRFDEARRSGLKGFYEESEQWENQKNRALEAYRKTKKQEVLSEEGPEAKADAAEKKLYAEQYEESRRTYTSKRTHQDVVVRESQDLPTEAEELGLTEVRPRYEYRKRVMFGGQPKYAGKATSSGSSRSSISPGGSSFPPPPTFDDFGGNNGGYVPAPNMPEDFGDIPPPPPPPMPSGDDFGGFGAESSDFPPPPPPPPPFNEDGAF